MILPFCGAIAFTAGGQSCARAAAENAKSDTQARTITIVVLRIGIVFLRPNLAVRFAGECTTRLLWPGCCPWPRFERSVRCRVLDAGSLILVVFFFRVRD